jgi:hypothetical protein
MRVSPTCPRQTQHDVQGTALLVFAPHESGKEKIPWQRLIS